MVRANEEPAPHRRQFNQARLDCQLVGEVERAQARIQVAAELGLSPFHREVVREVHRRARAAA